MLNISKVPFEQVDPDLQQRMVESDDALGGSEWIQVFSQSPDLYKAFVDFYYKHIMVEGDGISLKLTELVRHKVALINQCHFWQSAVYASARHQGLTDEMLTALPNFENSDLFSPAEKVALRFAEVMAGDHRSVSEDLSVALREHYTEPQIMALGWRMAIFVGYGRLVYVTGLEVVGQVCPLSFAHADMQEQADAGE